MQNHDAVWVGDFRLLKHVSSTGDKMCRQEMAGWVQVEKTGKGCNNGRFWDMQINHQCSCKWLDTQLKEMTV
jgi:hypothetical protein